MLGSLASDMRTAPEFITDMQKQTRSTEFACFVRNYTGNAVKLQIPFGALETASRMSDDQHHQLTTLNRERYAVHGEGQPDDDKETSKTNPQAKSAGRTPTDPDGVSTDPSGKW